MVDHQCVFLDGYLVERHEREIFPLLRRRYIFAEAMNFLLYDFYTPEGNVNEDVFAYSNQAGEEHALVVYHNKYASARGWIRTSAAYLVKIPGGSEPGASRQLVQKSLGEGLGLADDPDSYAIFRDYITGLEYIRNGGDICRNGLYIELDAYHYHVFMDFRQVRDDAWHQYGQLNAYLNGRGVPSIQEALKELLLQAVQHPFRELVNAGYIRWLEVNRLEEGTDLQTLLDEFNRRSMDLLHGVQTIAGGSGDLGSIAWEMRRDAEVLLTLHSLRRRLPNRKPEQKAALAYLLAGPSGKSPFDREQPFIWSVLHAWIACRRLGSVVNPSDTAEISRSWIDEWQFGKIILEALQGLGVDPTTATEGISLIKLLISHGGWSMTGEPHEIEGEIQQMPRQFLQAWLRDAELQRFLGFNRYQGILWFNKESFDKWIWWAFTSGVIDLISRTSEKLDKSTMAEILTRYQIVQRLQQAAEASGYQVERLLEASKGD